MGAPLIERQDQLVENQPLFRQAHDKREGAVEAQERFVIESPDHRTDPGPWHGENLVDHDL